MMAPISEKLAGPWYDGGFVELELGERPTTLSAAEMMQDQFIAGLGLVAAGWKLGASNIASQTALGLPRPFSGLLPADRVFASGATVDVSGWRHRGVECELAVSLQQDIEPGTGKTLGRDETLSLLGPVHPALEIPETRFKTLATTEGPLALVADNGASGRTVIGPASDIMLGHKGVDFPVELTVNDRLMVTGNAEALIADPLDLVTDHINRMLGRGYRLRRGEFVLLGSLTPYQTIDADGEIKADFGAVGTVQITYFGVSGTPANR
ncbi:2-keto-4-pentenoate hydratase [Kordiimonas aestuarii]|uniref:2-keto-4-pentenoate hydratase n=1 Tax=Kordiimonas aestuarii TaxID=1005925 RepID=UPI0021CE372F|nr:hypothetical protein [Kordiimonas aestuarii]